MAILDADLFAKLTEILKQGTYFIPDDTGYGGSGVPGIILEKLLGFHLNNRDGPDSGTWELKFHGGNSLLTLFHKTPEPKGNMHSIIRTCGWPDKQGRTSFRHTIYGKSSRGFEVVNENNRIIVKNQHYLDIIPPFWTHDTLLNAFAYKLRRLVLVSGSVSKAKKTVTYKTIRLYREPNITSFIDSIIKGTIAIDFDARTNRTGSGLRDHGTKFRIDIKNLDKLYQESHKFD